MRDKVFIDWLYTFNMHVKQTPNYMHGIAIYSGDFNLVVWQILPKSKQITYD